MGEVSVFSDTEYRRMTGAVDAILALLIDKQMTQSMGCWVGKHATVQWENLWKEYPNRGVC